VCGGGGVRGAIAASGVGEEGRHSIKSQSRADTEMSGKKATIAERSNFILLAQCWRQGAESPK
jgi:hypothetical protein